MNTSVKGVGNSLFLSKIKAFEVGLLVALIKVVLEGFMGKILLAISSLLLITACGQETQFDSTAALSSKSTQSSIDVDDGIGDEIVDREDLDEGEIHIEDIDLVEDAYCGREGQDHKVLVCHHPSGNIENRHDICISKSALRAHIGRHGDEQNRNYLGSCDDSVEESEEVSQGDEEDCDHKEGKKRRRNKNK